MTSLGRETSCHLFVLGRPVKSGEVGPHAYTQLGADIDGRRWPVQHFAQAEVGLKEGLAQYYTERVLNRLERRNGGALKAYRDMLLAQPEVYRTHKLWVEDYSPEAVRRPMLEVRRWKEGKLADFNRQLAEAQKELQPEKRFVMKPETVG